MDGSRLADEPFSQGRVGLQGVTLHQKAPVEIYMRLWNLREGSGLRSPGPRQEDQAWVVEQRGQDGRDRSLGLSWGAESHILDPQRKQGRDILRHPMSTSP